MANLVIALVIAAAFIGVGVVLHRKISREFHALKAELALVRDRIAAPKA